MAPLEFLLLGFVVLLCNVPANGHRIAKSRARCFKSKMTIYDEDHRFVTLQNNTEVALSQFLGANWQYRPLNALQQREGLTVLGFPCNQFGLQEPGSNDEILSILEHVRPGNGFRPNFPLFQKLNVNGNDAHPMFKFMKGQCNIVTSSFASKERLFYDPIQPTDIEWNYHKFLVDHRGFMHRRYHHNVSPDSPILIEDIEELLRVRALSQS